MEKEPRHGENILGEGGLKEKEPRRGENILA